MDVEGYPFAVAEAKRLAMVARGTGAEYAVCRVEASPSSQPLYRVVEKLPAPDPVRTYAGSDRQRAVVDRLFATFGFLRDAEGRRLYFTRLDAGYDFGRLRVGSVVACVVRHEAPAWHAKLVRLEPSPVYRRA